MSLNSIEDKSFPTGQAVDRRTFLKDLFWTTAAGLGLYVGASKLGRIYTGSTPSSSNGPGSSLAELETQMTQDVILGENFLMGYACSSELNQEVLIGTIEFLGVGSDRSPIFAADKSTRLLADQGTFQPRASIGPGNSIVVKSPDLPTQWNIGVVSGLIDPSEESSSGPSVLLKINLRPRTQNTSPQGLNRIAVTNPSSSRNG